MTPAEAANLNDLTTIAVAISVWVFIIMVCALIQIVIKIMDGE